MKYLLLLTLLAFTSCKKCEYCTTARSVVYSGDTTAPMRYNEYSREECGTESEETKTIKRVETRNNITITTTEVTTCIQN